jgi:UDP:flavonoid glycosyltransferase YjiC (YdhE family)
MAEQVRVLFFAEAVTLAHLARPLALAAGLDPARYHVTLACDARYRPILDAQPFAWAPLHSIPSRQFMDALARGSPVYDLDTLEGYVSEDLKFIDTHKPDIDVGDFRLSLSVSARLRRVPYAALANAYWSPYARLAYPVPALPFVRWTGVGLATALFRLARPLAFAMHSLPISRLRARHGLTPLGPDLRRAYTDADHTLYADVPELIPTRTLPANHRYLGPILWSPPVAAPQWWNALPGDKPLIYLTLGSSGAGELLPAIVRACADLPVTLIVAGAGHTPGADLPGNVFWADYLPGTQAAARASLVICNGGSPTSQQALAAGVPVLGIAGNLDQFLNMQAVIQAGAGRLLRQDRCRAAALRADITALLSDPAYRVAAQRIAGWFARYPAPQRFARFLEDTVPRHRSANHSP